MTIVPLASRKIVSSAPHPEPASSGPVSVGSFRAAMRQLPGGVSVVTSGRDGGRTGLVATSVSSLSAEPPTLMFGLNLASSTALVLRRQGAFAVNFLAASHADVAERFSGRRGEKGEERYAGAHWSEGVTGSALLDGALASLDCEVEELIERHTHAIVIGRIREIRIGRQQPALIYRDGRFESSLSPQQSLPSVGLRAF